MQHWRRAARGITLATLVALACVALPTAAGAANPWTRLAVPSPGVREQQLAAVSCVSATQCTAVGYFVYPSGGKTLIVRTTDGVTWTRVYSSPSPGTEFSILNDVSCTSANECTAVGYFESAINWGTARKIAPLVIRTVDGSTWQRILVPYTSDIPSALNSVNCVTATRCRAVGHSGGTTLVLRTGNGLSWFRQPTPDLGSGANYLNAIDCVSNINCTAVGYYYPVPLDTALVKTLVLRTTNGTTWNTVPSPNPAPSRSGTWLSDVDCSSPSDCTTVGSLFPKPGPVERGFILRTTTGGASWTRAGTPAAAGQIDLLGLDCESPVLCTAVGYAWNAAGDIFSTSILRTTDGVSWASPSPSSERVGYGLGSVSCVLADKCVGVGTFNTSGSFAKPIRNLVLREA